MQGSIQEVGQEHKVQILFCKKPEAYSIITNV
jgi:hypothetical protein